VDVVAGVQTTFYSVCGWSGSASLDYYFYEKHGKLARTGLKNARIFLSGLLRIPAEISE
jgi:hypothetical protein